MPALYQLGCYCLRPAVFSKSLTHLTFGYGISWSKRELEAMLLRLQLLPLLEFISIDIINCGVILSSLRLSALELPNLEALQLRMTQFQPHLAFDLTWLSECERSFELILVLEMDDSPDQLLGFSRKIQPVLQPSDSLYLEDCEAICQPAQQVLSELKLFVGCLCPRPLQHRAAAGS